MSTPDIIGLMGVALVLIAYGMVSAGRWASTERRYPIVNIVGTVMILYSLLYAWNLPAVIAQMLWIILSLLGLLRGFVLRRKKL